MKLLLHSKTYTPAASVTQKLGFDRCLFALVWKCIPAEISTPNNFGRQEISLFRSSVITFGIVSSISSCSADFCSGASLFRYSNSVYHGEVKESKMFKGLLTMFFSRMGNRTHYTNNITEKRKDYKENYIHEAHPSTPRK